MLSRCPSVFSNSAHENKYSLNVGSDKILLLTLTPNGSVSRSESHLRVPTFPHPLITHHIPSILPPKCIFGLLPLDFLLHSLSSCLPVRHCSRADRSSHLLDLSSSAHLPQWPYQLFSPSIWLKLLNSSPHPATESLPFFPWFKKHFTCSFQFHTSSWLPP